MKVIKKFATHDNSHAIKLISTRDGYQIAEYSNGKKWNQKPAPDKNTGLALVADIVAQERAEGIQLKEVAYHG